MYSLFQEDFSHGICISWVIIHQDMGDSWAKMNRRHSNSSFPKWLWHHCTFLKNHISRSIFSLLIKYTADSTLIPCQHYIQFTILWMIQGIKSMRVSFSLTALLNIRLGNYKNRNKGPSQLMSMIASYKVIS